MEVDYIVEYDGFKIGVKAKNEKQAKYRAWLKWGEVYGIKFLDFVRKVTDVVEV